MAILHDICIKRYLIYSLSASVLKWYNPDDEAGAAQDDGPGLHRADDSAAEHTRGDIQGRRLAQR